MQPYEINVIVKGMHGIVRLPVSILTLLLTSCVNLGKLFNLLASLLINKNNTQKGKELIRVAGTC